MLRILLAIPFIPALILSACNEETGCEDDYDCEGAFVCRVSTGTCEAFVCEVDEDCEGGETCDDNVCSAN